MTQKYFVHLGFVNLELVHPGFGNFRFGHLGFGHLGFGLLGLKSDYIYLLIYGETIQDETRRMTENEAN